MSMQDKTEAVEALKLKILSKREEWRRVRALRLNKKDEFLKIGLEITEIRKDKEYKELQRQQKRLSKEIRHLEKKLNRFFH